MPNFPKSNLDNRPGFICQCSYSLPIVSLCWTLKRDSLLLTDIIFFLSFRKNSSNGVVVGSLLFMLVSHGLQGDSCQGFESVLDCSVVQLMFLNLLVLLVCSISNLGKPWIIMGQTVYALGGFMFVRSGLTGMPPSVTNIMDMFIFYPTMSECTLPCHSEIFILVCRLQEYPQDYIHCFS